jgi:hypothetical protein
MSDLDEVLSDISFRVRALERREHGRLMQDILRRIELLESARGIGSPKGNVASDEG